MDNTEKKTNHFDRLHDELLLSIMNRMADDLKSLCRCSLLSKRFASVVFSLEALSPTIPCHPPYYEMSYEEVSRVFQQILDYPIDHLTTIIRSSSIEVPKVFLFLQKFNKLKSIHLQIAFPVSRSSFLKWKAKCTTSGVIIDGFVAILAPSVSKKIENGSSYPLRCCKERLILLCLLVKLQHSLQSVTITDTGEQRILVMTDENLVEFRKSLLCRGGLKDLVEPTLLTGWLKELRLPSSGLVMKRVRFMFLGSAPDPPGSPVDCSEVVRLGYEGQDKLLGEVMREIVINHRRLTAADEIISCSG